MDRYSHDVESVELTNEEHTAFAHLVGYLCHLPEQHQTSLYIARIKSPQSTTEQDFVQRQARRMWRTEVRI